MNRYLPKAINNKITSVDILVNSSRGITESNIETINEFKIEDNGIKYDKIILSLPTSFEHPEKEIQKMLEQDAKLYTLAISKLEQHLEFGCPYFTLDWKNKRVQNNAEISCYNNQIEVIEKLQVDHYLIGTRINVFKLSELEMIYNNNYLKNEDNNLLLDNYYYACISDLPQTKYFYLFIIFEFYENIEFFRNNLIDKLFSEDEIKNILNVFKNSVENAKRKKDIINELKNRTLKTRSEKFFEYLSNCRKIDAIDKYSITENDIKNIITQRNKLFHTSLKFDVGILYKKLFPIIQELLLNDLFRPLQKV
jgi:hypothetical protein